MNDNDGSSAALGATARQRIRTISGSQVQTLIAKLNVLLPFLPLSPFHELPLEEWLSPLDITRGEVADDAARGGKHVLQEASILSHLRHIGALSEERNFTAIELGAGTGRLSDRLHRVTRGRMHHVLVDRRHFPPNRCRDRIMMARGRAEKKGTNGDESRANDKGMMSESEDVGDGDCQEGRRTVERLVMDIASFDLGKYCADTRNNVIGSRSNNSDGGRSTCLCMSKHLCGPACDLALASISRVAAGPTSSSHLPPCALATCCHFLCTWDSFSGKTFWLKLGLTKEDFEVAVVASQWASLNNKVDGKKFPPSPPPPPAAALAVGCDDDGAETTTTTTSSTPLPDMFRIADEAAKAFKVSHSAASPPPSPPTPALLSLSSDAFERAFSRKEKAELGTQMKRLIDLSRAARLQELGYRRVKLVRYTTRSSVDDRLLVAGLH